MTATDRFNFSGRVAIITGSGSGIGRAMALTFAGAGAAVVVIDNKGVQADETVRMIAEAGGEAVAKIVDICDEQAVDALVDETAARWGRVDVLCNNAGILDKLHGPESTTTEMWNRVMAVNVTGQFFMTRAVLRHMLPRKSGVIINTASEAGFRGGCAGTAYTASKHAAIGLTRSTAWMHAENGIRCNAICPGATETNIASDGLAGMDQAGMGRTLQVMQLMPRAAKPQVMADTALFLASDAAAHINGAIIPVDGGWSVA